MKKILVGFLIAGLSIASANNTAKSFKNGATQTGGVIDNEVVFMYNKEINLKDDNSLALLTNIAKQKICTDKSAAEIIKTAGMTVKYSKL